MSRRSPLHLEHGKQMVDCRLVPTYRRIVRWCAVEIATIKSRHCSTGEDFNHTSTPHSNYVVGIRWVVSLFRLIRAGRGGANRRGRRYGNEPTAGRDDSFRYKRCTILVAVLMS